MRSSALGTNTANVTEGGLILEDTTTKNATTSAHGLCPKLSNNSSEFLNGVGAWATPSSGGSPGGNSKAIQFNSSGSFAGDESKFAWDNTNSRLGINVSSPATGIEYVATRYVNTNCLQLRTNDAAAFSGTGLLRLNAAEDSGYTTIAGYNSAGTKITGFSADGTTEYGFYIIKSDTTEFTTGSTTRPTLSMKLKASQSASLFRLQDSSGNTLMTVKPKNIAVDSRLYYRLGHTSNTDSVVYKFQIVGEKYVDDESFVMATSDSGVFGGGTGSFRFNPAGSSGLCNFETCNGDGTDFQAYNADGSSLYGRLRFNSSGITITNTATNRTQLTVKGTASQGSTQKIFDVQISSGASKFAVDPTGIGFFATTPAAQQSGAAQTAGATYDATAQDMLQKAYNCLRTFGLLA